MTNKNNRLRAPQYGPSALRAEQAVEGLRIVIALLIWAHGAHRALNGGVAPFGIWLETQGFSHGWHWAAMVTALEWIGPMLMLMRRYVAPVAAIHVVILTLGLLMVHRPHGWWVVGAGRNGMEYSVLLIAGLIALIWAWWPFQRGRK